MDELRKLAMAAITGGVNGLSQETHYEAFQLAASPTVVLGLMDDVDAMTAMCDSYAAENQRISDERDEARAAVKRLAGALASAVSGLEYCRDMSDRQDVANCATGGVAFGDKALADPVVRRIVEEE